MALKAAHVRTLNENLADKEIFDIVNKYLKEKNLGDFALESLKIRRRGDKENVHMAATNECAGHPCPPGQHGQMICRPSGICACECRPIMPK